MKPFPLAVLLSLTLTASAAAQTPTTQQLSELRLHDGFTLTYKVTVRDIRTPALRQKDVADQQKGIADAVAAGHMTKEDAARYEKDAPTLTQARPDEHFTITLSARDGKLLYLSNRSARDQKNGTRSAIVLDGDKEYEADGPEAAMINSDGWQNAPVYADENADRLAFCPLSGVGLPGVSLIQSPQPPSRRPNGHFLFVGLVPRLNLMNGATPYKAGSVEATLNQGRFQVVALTVGTAAVPQQTWQMTGFRLFQDHWLAARMHWTEYEASFAETGEKFVSDLPTAMADYQLVEARPSALDASAFEIGTYLRNAASVSDNSVGSTVTFAYDTHGGTLAEQAEAVRKKELQKDLPTP